MDNDQQLLAERALRYPFSSHCGMHRNELNLANVCREGMFWRVWVKLTVVRDR